MFDVETIKAKADLLTVAESAGARFHKSSHDEFRSHCPLHAGSDNSSAFAVYDNGTRWTCFTNDCGSGDVIEFVQKWQGCTFQQACEYLGGERATDPTQAARIAAERVQAQIERLEEEHKKTEMLLSELRETQTWLKYNDILNGDTRKQSIWESQGVPVSWQNYWQLGYCDDFRFSSSAGIWHTPTITIPIFIGEYELVNIRHRLLNPASPKDKYRPERPGLTSTPFYANPQMMYNNDRILYVEGEKKAMVTYLTLDSAKWQVIGLPGKGQWKREIEQIKGHRPFIWLDPDALDESREFAKLVHGRVIDIPIKVDDAIVDGILDKQAIQDIIRGAAA